MITAATIILTILSLFSAILLIAIVMMQQNKAGGGLGAVSGSVTETMFGASADNVLVKATTWCAVVFLASTLLLAAVTGRGANKKSIIDDVDIPAATAPATSAPAAAASAEPAAAPAESAPAAN